MPVLRAKLDSRGRVVIPAELRRRLGVKAGDSIVFDVRGHDIVVSSHHHALTTLQRMVRKATRHAPYTVADFLRERREAARAEDAAWERRR